MKPTIWTPVLITGLVLGLAGLPRSMWRTAAVQVDRWRAVTGPVVERLFHEGGEALRVGMATAQRTEAVWGPIGAALLAVVPLSAAFLLATRARRPVQRRVLDLARRGHHPADIARRTGLAQDAVRSVLKAPTK
jgi:hypothetical protein